MASGDLFRGFLLRFSMKKDQHVRMLEKFEDNRLNGGESQNPDYYGRTGNVL